MKLGKAFLVLALMSFVCGVANAQNKLIVGYTPSVSTAQLFVAKEQGMFARQNLDVQLVGGNGSIMISGLVSASFQISAPTVPTFLQAADAGLDVIEIASSNFATKSRPEYGVLFRNGVVVNNASDFVGKKVGVSTIGAFLHVLFVEWLKKNGVDPKRVTFIETPFSQMSEILKLGSVDAVVAVEPFIARIKLSKSGEMGPNFLTELPDNLPVVIFAATKDWAKANPETIKKFRAALAEAIVFTQKDLSKAREDVNKHLKLPPEVFANVLVPHLAVEPDPAGLRVWIDMMKGQRLLKGSPDAQSLVVP